MSSLLVQRQLLSSESVTYNIVFIIKGLCFPPLLVILFLFCISILHVPYIPAPYFLCSSEIQLHFSNLFYRLLQHILTAEKLKESHSQLHSSVLSCFPFNFAVNRKRNKEGLADNFSHLNN